MCTPKCLNFNIFPSAPRLVFTSSCSRPIHKLLCKKIGVLIRKHHGCIFGGTWQLLKRLQGFGRLIITQCRPGGQSLPIPLLSPPSVSSMILLSAFVINNGFSAHQQLSRKFNCDTKEFTLTAQCTNLNKNFDSSFARSGVLRSDSWSHSLEKSFKIGFSVSKPWRTSAVASGDPNSQQVGRGYGLGKRAEVEFTPRREHSGKKMAVYRLRRNFGRNLDGVSMDSSSYGASMFTGLGN